MSIKKTVAIAAAAGALAAISVPAMAFENEFHGMFSGKFYLSNYENGGIKAPQIAPALENMKTANYFEQRARLQYNAKASNDLKLVTQFELDSTFGGNGATGYKGITNGNNAGQLDADSITLETKHVYLDFNAGSTNVKVGIQPYKDAFKGIFLDADLSAINTTTKMGGLTLGAAFARVNNKGGVVYNELANDLFLLDTSYALNKDTKVGFSYYLNADYTTKDKASNIHTLGLNADAKMGPLSVSGFAAMQAGNKKNAGAASTTYHGYALNAAAKMAVGPGSAKTSILYTSGDDGKDNHNNGWQTPLSTFNESGMMILNRNVTDDGSTTDYSLTGTKQNGAVGQVLYTLGYDAKIGAKANVSANAGMLWCAKSTYAPNGNGGDLMATELNVQTGYKLYDNLTASFQAAYAMLGGYYTDSVGVDKEPENPYSIRLGLKYTF